jgi:hypothetical protein
MNKLKIKLSQIVLLISFCFATTTVLSQDSPWKPLFNGKDFNNFEKLNGDAEYRIENGEMVGV